jgi:hypothetical protein
LQDNESEEFQQFVGELSQEFSPHHTSFKRSREHTKGTENRTNFPGYQRQRNSYRSNSQYSSEQKNHFKRYKRSNSNETEQWQKKNNNNSKGNYNRAIDHSRNKQDTNKSSLSAVLTRRALESARRVKGVINSTHENSTPSL